MRQHTAGYGHTARPAGTTSTFPRATATPKDAGGSPQLVAYTVP